MSISSFLQSLTVFWWQENVRVLVNKRRTVVDLVVDDHVQVLLGGVGGDLLESEFLFFGHYAGGWTGGKDRARIE